jgi:serine/threonine protein phosphatase 1
MKGAAQIIAAHNHSLLDKTPLTHSVSSPTDRPPTGGDQPRGIAKSTSKQTAEIELAAIGFYVQRAFARSLESMMSMRSLLNFVSRSQPRACAVPEGARIYAIGDIHGRRDLLDRLLAQIDEDDAGRPPARTELIFLGDLVDRGPDSAGVVERLMALRALRPVRYLMGNHEEVLLRALEGDLRALRFLVRIGGRETLLSYGISADEYRELDYDELLVLLQQKVPTEHVAFLSAFENMIEVGDYLFVHAGLRPGVALEEQKTSDLCWIREDFLSHRDSFGKMVVHGHSITEEIDERPNRIGIDTGAFASGRLTAIGLEGDRRWYLST